MTTTTTTTTTINIYRNRGVWCYACHIGGEYDHSAVIDDAEAEAEARDEMQSQFPGAAIVRVADTNE